MSHGPIVFDRKRLAQQRERASAGLGPVAWLLDATLERLVERLGDVTRGFDRALVLGGWDGRVAAALTRSGKVGSVVASDLAPSFAKASPVPSLVADEEFLPFSPASFDLIVSPLVMHWVNDLPGTLLQARVALAADGLFLGALLGGETLSELRRAWLEAELAEEGGAGARVAPTVDLRDGAGLLQRAGFALPLADSERLAASYPDPLALMAELKPMGLAHALIERRKSPTRRGTLAAACARYQESFALSDGRIPASFELIFLSGWAPHPDQPQPLKRGSAEKRLADALGAIEIKPEDTP
ncbi:MAG: methyltransferase domain-containing protein [Alphaproteobacteria bacterium]|nr:methyltransferase domain-containing protein [Alphaproteobacteria bacterium]